jgi:tetratricopeptide (TPR) repeat protein
MLKPRHILMFFFWVLIGCGPETIFVRPGLDTPALHVSNGNQLLDQGKWQDACREFERARDLDPFYTDAYIGLGIAVGGQGDMAGGLKVLDYARELAQNEDDLARVQYGYDRLRGMTSPEAR